MQRLTNTDQQTMEWKQRMTEYNDKIKERLDNKNFMISLNGDQPLHSLYVTDLD